MEVIITLVAAIILMITLTVYLVRLVWEVLTDIAARCGPWYASLALLLFLSAVSFTSYST